MKREQFLEEKFGKHAAPISKHISEAIEKGTINLESEEDLDKFIEGLQKIQQEKTGRAASINLLNINNGKNTIEFRLANGSINPDTWIENTRLFGRIVEMSEKLAQIEKKNKDELTEEDRRLMRLMEDLKREQPENEKLGTLLELLFTEEERVVYRERYNENTRLMEEEEKKGDKPLKTLEFAKKVEFKERRHSINEFSDVAEQNRMGNYNVATSETRSGVIGENARGDNIIEDDKI